MNRVTFVERGTITHSFIEALLPRYRKMLLSLARTAAGCEAESWRWFFVGCAILAMNRMGELKIFTGGNCKPSEDSSTICAEINAHKKAFAEGYRNTLIIAVTAFPQPDKHSGKESPTLHPCGACRETLPNEFQVSDDTLIITASPYEDNPVEEHQSFLTLLRFHSDANKA